MNLRKCNLLWWRNVELLTTEDLELLKYAFSVGFIPLGDEYGDHNEKWVSWRKRVQNAIDSKLVSE